MNKLFTKLRNISEYAYSVNTGLCLYINPIMMVAETASGMSLEQSSQARVSLSLARMVTGSLSTFGRDLLENKLGFTNGHDDLKKISLFDKVYWVGVAGAEWAGQYLIYNNIFGAEHGLQSGIPALVGVALTANGGRMGKVIDTFKDGFEIAPHPMTTFPTKMSFEEKRKEFNKASLTAYATLATFYFYANGNQILESLRQIAQ